jgi:hypothetical protein
LRQSDGSKEYIAFFFRVEEAKKKLVQFAAWFCWFLWVPGNLSSGLKRPGHEADHSSATSAGIKKTWIYTSAPPYAFMA